MAVAVGVTLVCHSFDAVAVSVWTVLLGIPNGCSVSGFCWSTYTTELGTVTTAEAVILAVPGLVLLIVNCTWPLASVVPVVWLNVPKLDPTCTWIPGNGRVPLVTVTVIWWADPPGSWLMAVAGLIDIASAPGCMIAGGWSN